jgi:transposase
MGTYRYVYNRALDYSKHPYASHSLEYLFNPYHHLDNYHLRDMFVTKKGNENYLNEWEFNTPKDIRAGAVFEFSTNIRTNIKKVQSGLISNFKMNFKSKKDKSSKIILPKTCININDKGVQFFPTYMNSRIKINQRTKKSLLKKKIDIVQHDSSLIFNGYDFFLLIPFEKKVKFKSRNNKIIALDPGTRTFQTGYSSTEYVEANLNKKKCRKYEKKIKKLQSLQDRKVKKIRKNKLRLLYDKIKNHVNDLHWRTITFLRKHYNDVLIPIFESQKMVCGTPLNKKTKHDLLQLSHYTFKQRLIEKSKEYRNFRVYVVNESYTTKTCTNCGNLKDVGGSKTYKCDKCPYKGDRDVNASRNIFLKYCSLSM